MEKINLIKNDDINELKIILANEATTMLHGKLAASKALETAKKTFEGRSIGEDLRSVEVSKKQIDNGINLIDLVVTSKLLTSKSEVRRTIKNKGIKINNKTVDDERLIVSLKYFSNKNFLKLSYGKKKHIIVKII